MFTSLSKGKAHFFFLLFACFFTHFSGFALAKDEVPTQNQLNNPCNTPTPTGNTSQLFCNTASVSDLQATGTAIQWYATPNGTSMNPYDQLINGATYYATQTIDGCESSTPLAVTVSLNVDPSSISVSEISGVTSNDGVICRGSTANIAVQGGSTYAWSNGEVISSIAVSPENSSLYTVTVVGQNNCIAVLTAYITIVDVPLITFTKTENSGTTPNDGVICDGDEITISALGSSSYEWSNGEISSTIVVSPSASTSFTLTASNVCGCPNIVSVDVTVIPLPLTIQNVAICHGDSYVFGGNSLTTEGTYDQHFSSVNACDSTVRLVLTILPQITHFQQVVPCFGETYSIGTHTYTNPGTYVDTLTSVSGCDSIVTTLLDFYAPVDTEFSISELTLTASATEVAYQWFDCSANQVIIGATGQTFTITENGQYALIVTQNGCVDTSACQLIDYVGLEEGALSKLSIYPNPAVNSISIVANAPVDFIEIVDVNGKTIQVSHKKVSLQTIDVSGLKKGLYFLKATSQGQSITKQFVKQ